MWRLGYRTPRKKNPEQLFWEYTFVAGNLEKVFERVRELQESMKLEKFSIEWREENKNV